MTTPQLEGLRLSKMHPVVIKSRDGLDLVSYLSFPPWSDGNEDGRPAQPVPLVMLVHGGPSDERAQYGYGPFLHWLTNRGYGVLYVNYRGSPGFGKAFVNGQRMEWGGKMHEDLLDQVEWAIAQGITTRDKVAILGGSYGGYADAGRHDHDARGVRLRRRPGGSVEPRDLHAALGRGRHVEGDRRSAHRGGPRLPALALADQLRAPDGASRS